MADSGEIRIEAAQPVQEAQAPKRGRKRTLLVAGAAVLVAGLGAAWIALPGSRESTDDAYVEADSSVVAPRVRGFVSAILVKDHALVKAGQPLASIDPEEFDARLANAEADLADARADEAAARAALGNLSAEERLALADIGAARTGIRSSQAEAQRADADRRRYDALVESGAISRSEADRVRASAVTAEQDAAHADALLGVSREKAGVVRSRRAMLLAEVQKAQAQVLKSAAALTLARQDRGHAMITAPVAGVIANRQANVGDYVQPGTRLLSVVPVSASYVTAYFKETQVARMHAGQKAEIEIDALGGRDLTGTVDSLAPGSGSQFSLLPFEPGTGNFTKIVQRVPVRIRFDPGQAPPAGIRPGLSATVHVRLEG